MLPGNNIETEKEGTAHQTATSSPSTPPSHHASHHATTTTLASTTHSPPLLLLSLSTQRLTFNNNYRPTTNDVTNGQNELSTEGAATLWTTPTCPSLTRRHPKTSANSTLGKSTAPTDYSSPSFLDPTATLARSSATSFLAKGDASPCPRSRTGHKPTSHTSAPPPTPPPSMSSPQHAPTGSATSPGTSLATLTRHPPHVNISSRSLGSTPRKPLPSCSTTHSSTSSAPCPASRPPISLASAVLRYQKPLSTKPNATKHGELDHLTMANIGRRCTKEVAKGCNPEQNCLPIQILASAKAVDPAIIDYFGLEVERHSTPGKYAGNGTPPFET
ncbi:hypothetical protein THAOC_15296 [Thalassiosira oceanica]|uniref:Uncharacterized protein n=1 Tax=Thalassiosira oceanica TaxID=159749 RepID=K0SG95_THAOC|nr:hypothetical protein THAOC_15296 [Thalassiosira oceanica]|eukprot:EJK64014.1 hypothetical protein THAOC_15296 [Thalassiosira oceanica]